MNIRRLPLGMLETNCYLLEDEATGLCAVIDPAAEADVILSVAEQDGMSIAAILITHSHFDHIGAVPALHAALPEVPIYIHPLELTALEGYEGNKLAGIDGLRHYEEGDTVTVGSLTLKVLHTPGHSAGSVTLQLGEEALFTGDTLFHYSCGRTDLAGGNKADMMASLARLAALPGNPAVLPGHDRVSTLDSERAGNPYMRKR